VVALVGMAVVAPVARPVVASATSGLAPTTVPALSSRSA
jgi:hypothetical protein